jgi:hypothetical protein
MSKTVPYQIAIVGGSGKGKTMAFRNMNPQTCGFINMEKKPLPFINNFKFYCTPKNWQEAYQKLIEYAKDPEITEVVFDSISSYIDSVLKLARETKKGYDQWNLYNETISQLLEIITLYPKDLIVTAHYELKEVDGGAYTEKRIGVKGSEHSKVGIERIFTIVNYAESKMNVDNKIEYTLRLNTLGSDTAKTPPMFVEAFGDNVNEIPNDANLLLSTIRKTLINSTKA